LFSHAVKKFSNLPTKAPQINCILFYRAAKIFGICQQKQLKLTAFVLPRSKNFGIASKRTVFCSAAQRKIWNCEEQAHCVLFSRAAKFF
jgi:hypothetical protein